MSTVTVVVIVIVAVLIVGAIGYLARAQMERRRLRARFGPEYDRTVERHGNTREAEQELRAREQRHDELDIRPVDPAARDRYLADWQRIQERFVDRPEAAVSEADELVTKVLTERGYPAEDYEQQLADLSVEHAATLDRYRTAHDIRTRSAGGAASTEDLRQAMVHYRTLFAELLGADPSEPVSGGTAQDEATTTDEAETVSDEAVSDEAVRDDAVRDEAAVRGETARRDGTARDGTVRRGPVGDGTPPVAAAPADGEPADARRTSDAAERRTC